MNTPQIQKLPEEIHDILHDISTENALNAIAGALERIERTLAQIAEVILERAGQPAPGNGRAPNFQRQLAEYPTFNWASIQAEQVAFDCHGATIVKWRGQEFHRRRHPDYNNAVWFSVYTGQTDDKGNKIYSRLITFTDRPRVVKSLPDEVADLLPAPPPVTLSAAKGLRPVPPPINSTTMRRQPQPAPKPAPAAPKPTGAFTGNELDTWLGGNGNG